MRWQPFAVAAGFAIPPLVLAIAVWPSNASADGDGDGDGGTDEIVAELGPGDVAEGEVSGTQSADYLVTGDGEGPIRIMVSGNGFDSTLTLTDPDSGEALDFNDDTAGLDPMLVVELDDGESVVAEVRSLGGDPGIFAIVVDHGDGADVPGGPAPVPLPVPVPAGPGVAPTTIAP